MRKGSKTLSIAIKGQKTSSFKKINRHSLLLFWNIIQARIQPHPLKKERETNKQTNKNVEH